MDNVAQAINEHIVRELMADKPDAVLDNDEPLIEGGIVDSLGIFLLVAFIENQFGIKVQPEDVVLDNFKTVNTIRDLVMARQSTGSEVGP